MADPGQLANDHISGCECILVYVSVSWSVVD